jgi:hypothetical protein
MAAAAEAVKTPAEIVRQAFDESPDVHTAARTLEQWAQNDRALYDYLTESYLATACYESVRGLCRSERRAVSLPPNYSAGGNGHRVAEHAESCLDFPLPGGKRMRHATQSDLREASEFYRKQAQDMQRKADWFAAIAERVGRKKVGTVFDDESLRALY